MSKNALWLAFSGAGAEFIFTGKIAEITVLADGNVPFSERDSLARISVNMNGRRVVDDIVDKPEKTYQIIESEAVQTFTVQVVKLSEAANSAVAIKCITVDDAAEVTPSVEKLHRVEFIGDSITCGYGIDDENPSRSFSTGTEDVTKTYAFKTATSLNADYSMVCASGYGIISGYTVTGEKLASATIPQHYGKVNLTGEQWNFHDFVPEIIVINIGTNDDSYCLDYSDRQLEFKDKYIEFIEQVRRCNPLSQILCVLGIMGDRLFPFVEAAVKEYSEKTGDRKISAMKFDVQGEEDGLVADLHPTEKTHNKAAEKHTAEIKAIMKW